MKKTILFSGSHSRHLFVHKKILEIFDEVLVIVVNRENVIPPIPLGLDGIDKINFIRHFKERQTAENKAFGKLNINRVFGGANILRIDPNNLNSKMVLDEIKSFSADFCFIFGSELIEEPLFTALPNIKINLHLGLSPWYRGSATFFWPFYFLEPQYAGVTFHQITLEPDAGAIYHQECPKLYAEDGIHDVGVRAVVNASDTALKVCKNIITRNTKGFRQKTSGRVWRGVDFMPSHLRVIYNLYENDIVKYYLNGSLSKRKPKLIKLDL